MKNSIIALVDCDSFFVSCEQALNKDLQDKPVCVLSNNKACVIARSKEAKQMGIKMGMPYFMAKKEFPEGIYIQGNLQTYKDFSRKVMAILRDFSPSVEVYSIDEAFVELSGLKRTHKMNYYKMAKAIRERIKNELGINVSIGLSKTKVLAKLACENAKKGISLPPLRGREFFDAKNECQKNWVGGTNYTGIYLIGQSKIKKILKTTKIEEIWGIGKNTTIQLNRWGILNCQELVDKSDEWLKSNVGKTGVEIKHELLGEYIYRVNPARRLPKSIQNTRSFPKFTNDLSYIKNALNIHIHTSCTKLRYLKGKCKTVSVMLKTKDFVTYYDKKNLDDLCNFELEISHVAIEMIEKLYNPDLIYRSCGICLENLSFEEGAQLNLFAKEKSKNFDKLATALDKLEKKFGKNVVKTGFTWDEFEE